MSGGNNWQPADPELARVLDRLRAAEAALGARVDAVQAEVAGWLAQTREQRGEHRTRTWQVILACVSGVVLPLVSIGVLALIHLVTKR